MDFNKKYLKYKSKYFKLKNKNKIKDLINSKRIKVIVARYNEDISWLNKIKDFVILYNKGKDDLKDWNAIKLKNVGRETDTYLNYIIENYNNLPEICIFTQGNIKDHYYGGYKYLLKLGVEALNDGISKPQKNYPSTGNFNNMEKFNNYKYYDDKRILFRDWFEKNLGLKYPKNITYFGGGIFAVSRSNILKNDLDFYKKMLKYVNHDIDPMEGHFLERSWYYIFTK